MPDSSPSRSEPSLRASLLRQLGGAVLLVAVVSGVFWGIGTMDRTTDGELAGQSADEPSGAPDDDDAARPPDQPEEPTDDAAEPDVDTDDGTDAAADDDAAEDAGDPTVDESAADDDGASGEDEADDDEADDGDDPEPDEPPAPQDPTIDPATISVQVLDGYQADGGAAANAVTAELREAGYNIIAQNPALRYEVTTVLWTAGHEAEARQVAAEIGATEAREQSGNLSSQVAVHVVVGSDRG